MVLNNALGCEGNKRMGKIIGLWGGSQ